MGSFITTTFPGSTQTLGAAFGYDLTSDPGTWVYTDITTDVQWDPGIKIRIGNPDESIGLVPASLTATLDNTQVGGGSYTMNNPTGAYWPHVKENVPILATLNIGGGNVVRFQGYATSWKPRWDAKRKLFFVDLVANGIARRLKQGKSASRSAMWRFNMLADRYPTNTNGGDHGDFGIGQPDYNGTGQGYHAAPVHYWPMEDRSGSLVAGNAANPSYPMNTTTDTAQGLPSFAARTVGTGSQSIPVFGDGARLSASFPPVSLGADHTGSFPTYTTGCVSWLQHIPKLPDSDSEIMRVRCTGTIGAIVLVWVFDPGSPTQPSFRTDVYDQAGALIVTTGAAFDDSFAVNAPVWMLLRIEQQGSDVLAELNYCVFDATPSSGLIFPHAFFGSVTATGQTVGKIQGIDIANDGNLPDFAIGHVGLYNGGLGALPTTTARAVLGRRGDTPDQRIDRTSLEDGVPVDIIGTSDIALGPQKTGGYLDIVSEAADADAGMLLDGLGPGMTFICRTEAYALAPTLTLDAAGGMIPGPVEPEHDDQYRVNEFTARSPVGSEATYTKDTGTLSTAEVGIYDDSGDICVALDSTLLDHAGWRVAQGTVPGLRYPTLQFQLAKIATSAVADDWLTALPFQRIAVTALEPNTTQPDRSFLLRGWQEAWTSKTWSVTATVTPYDAYGVGVLADLAGSTGEYVMRYADDGVSVLAAGVSAGATSLSVLTPSGPLWTNATAPTVNYADDIVGLKILVDGIIISVTSITGATSPQTFTVTGSTVTKALSAGAVVEVYQPNTTGL